jgi:hypothetical protein
VNLSFTATDGKRAVGIGEKLPVDTGTPVTFQLNVSGVPGTRVRLLDQVGQQHTEVVPDSGTLATQWTTYRRYTRWLRAEVRRSNAMVAMTNPIFLDERRRA